MAPKKTKSLPKLSATSSNPFAAKSVEALESVVLTLVTIDNRLSRALEPLLRSVDWLAQNLGQIYERLDGINDVNRTLIEQPQAEKVVLLKELVESQKALTSALVALTARGPVTRAKKEKVEPASAAAIVAGVNEAGKDIAREQASALAAASAQQVSSIAAAATGGLLDDEPDLGGVVKEAPPALHVVKEEAQKQLAEKPALTLDLVKQQFLTFVAKNPGGKPKAIELLGKFGAQLVSQVPQEQWQKFYEACGG